MPLPADFDGHPLKVQSFVRSLTLYMLNKRGEFEDDEERIIWALSFFKDGVAGTWAENLLNLYTKSLEEVPEGEEEFQLPEHATDWNKFIAEVKRIFGDVDEMGTAQSELRRLRQGAETADEFNVKFQAVADKTGFNEEAKMDRYKRAINVRLLDSIAHCGAWPKTLREWMDTASRLDRMDRDFTLLKIEREGPRSRAPPPRYRSVIGTSSSAPNPPAAAPRYGTPANRQNTPTPAVPAPQVKVEQTDRIRSRSSVICYKCRQTGHYARDCPNARDINNMSWEEIRALVLSEDQPNGQVDNSGFQDPQDN